MDKMNTEIIDSQILADHVAFLDNCFDNSFILQSSLLAVKEYVSQEQNEIARNTKVKNVSTTKFNTSSQCFNNTILENSIYNKKSTKHIKISNNLKDWGLPMEITRRYAERGISEMFDWQVSCLSNSKVLLDCCNLVYSAPTSAGKTLVAEILSIKTILERQKKVIIILPFVSIVREKMFYLQDILSSSGIRVEGFMGSQSPPGGLQAVHVAICTIEKANSLINKLLDDGKIFELGAVIVDEMHLLGDPNRGYILELLLTKLKYVTSKSEDVKIQIVGMSATLPNLEVLASWLEAELFVTDFRPIPLDEYCLVGVQYYDKYGNQVNALKSSLSDCDPVLEICLETIKSGCSVLIFCMTKNRCENLALSISSTFFKLGCESGDNGIVLRNQLHSQNILEVLEQLRNCPVGLDDVLKRTISFGVAYHHAGLTFDERDIVEGGFKSGAIRVLVATSTLSSGVNLPARKVIIRTPVFQRQPINILTYKQMVGRAGRMGKDSKGESILICTEMEKKIGLELMMGKLNPVKSCIDCEDKYMRALLEMIASQVVFTNEELVLYSKCTLLYAQKNEPTSLTLLLEKTLEDLKNYELIRKQMNGEEVQYVATPLGKACLSSSMAPNDGLSLFCELQRARQCLVLETDLHLIYLVTPYSVSNQWGDIDWLHLLTLWESLTKAMQKVGELVGVQESFIIHCLRGTNKFNKDHNKLNIHKRFYTALALQDLVNEVPLSEVATKFQCARGFLQSLQQAAATFAGMVTAFCRQLGWNNMEMLISQFQDRLNFGIHSDLLELMKLSTLNGMRARKLFNAGFETISSIALADVNVIESVLLKSVPFESDKEKVGDDQNDIRKRRKIKNIWITGRNGLTAKDATCILITEARKYLEQEIGVSEIKWNANVANCENGLVNSGGDKLKNIETEVDCEIEKCIDTNINKKLNVLTKSSTQMVNSKENEVTNQVEMKSSKQMVNFDENAVKAGMNSNKQIMNFREIANEVKMKSSKEMVDFDYNVAKPDMNSNEQMVNSRENGSKVKMKSSNPRVNFDQNAIKADMNSNKQMVNFRENDSKLEFKTSEVMVNFDQNAIKADTNANKQMVNFRENANKVEIKFSKIMLDFDENAAKADINSNKQMMNSGENGNKVKMKSNKQMVNYDQNAIKANMNSDKQMVDFRENANKVKMKSSKEMVNFDQNAIKAEMKSNEQIVNSSQNTTKKEIKSPTRMINSIQNTVKVYDTNNYHTLSTDKSVLQVVSKTELKKEYLQIKDETDWESLNLTEGTIQNITKVRTSEKTFSPNISFGETEIEEMNISNKTEKATSSKCTSDKDLSLFSFDGDDSSLFEESLTLDSNSNKIFNNKNTKEMSLDHLKLDSNSTIDILKCTIPDNDEEEDFKLVYDEDTSLSNVDLIHCPETMKENVLNNNCKRHNAVEKDSSQPEAKKKKIDNEMKSTNEYNIYCIDNCIQLFTLNVNNKKSKSFTLEIGPYTLSCHLLRGNDIINNIHMVKHMQNSSIYLNTRNLITASNEIIGSNVFRIPKSPKLGNNCWPVQGIAVYFGQMKCVYFDYSSLDNHYSIIDEVISTWFTSESLTLKVMSLKTVNFYIKRWLGIDLLALCVDISLLEWLTDNDEKIPNISYLLKKYCGVDFSTIYFKSDDHRKRYQNLDVCENMCVKAWAVWMVAEQQEIQFKERYANIIDVEIQISKILSNCEHYGVTVDKELASRLLIDVRNSQEMLQKKAYKLCGYHFNFNASKDVAKVLGIYSGRRVSTKKSVLTSHRGPMSSIVIYWRKLNSILTKTLYPLTEKAWIYSEGDRINPSYSVYTCTGRISMHEPNLQNVPRTFSIPLEYLTLNNVKTDEAVEFNCRNIFKAAPGYVLVSADYCQLEMRLLTHFSGDSVLTDIMKSDVDVFKSIAASWGNVPEDEVDDDLRQKAKQLCYGILYGMGNRTLAQHLDVSEIEAAAFMESFYTTYPSVKSFSRTVVEECRKNGYVETLTKRRRYISDINSNVISKRNTAERQAVNTTIQGSAADIAKAAMCAIDMKMRNYDPRPRLILQMHDELIYEVPEPRRTSFVSVIKQVMEGTVKLRVPLPVKVKCGLTWGTLTEVSPTLSTFDETQ